MKKLVLWLTIIAATIPQAAWAVIFHRHEDVVRNTSGRIVSGASIYVYVADTDSLATLFSDKAGATGAVNPVKSDANGRFGFYAAPGTYDLTIERTGITTYTVADVSIGGNDLRFSVKEYGAKGNGTTDDQTAIELAIAAATAAGRGEVYFPSGTYAITNEILVEHDDIVIAGDGIGATIITPKSGTTGIHGILIRGANDCMVTDMTLTGFTWPGASEANGIRVEGGERNVVADCAVYGCDDAGISVGYDIDAYFAQTRAEEAVPKTAIDGGHHIIVRNIITDSAEGCGIEIMRADNCLVGSNYIEGNSTWGVRVTGSYGTNVTGNRIVGSTSGVNLQAYGDASGVGIRVTKNSRNCSVVGNTIECDFGIKLFDGVFATTVVGNNIEMTDDTGGVGIEMAATTDSLTSSNAVGDILVSGNMTYGGAVGALVTAEGYGITVAGNTFCEFDWIGVYASPINIASAADTLRGLSVDGNTFRPGWNQPSHTVKYGIWAAGTQTTGVIGANVFDTFGYSGTWAEYNGSSGMTRTNFPAITASAAPDTVGRRGLVWYDKVNDKLKVYNGSGWQNLH